MIYRSGVGNPVNAASSIARWKFGELSLQRAAMHSQQFGALRDVAAAICQYPLNVLPFDAGKGGNGHRRLHASALAIAERLKAGRICSTSTGLLR